MRKWICVAVLIVMMIESSIIAARASSIDNGAETAAGLSNARIIVVRHAEKASHGTGLSAAGKTRAEIYAAYFLTLKVNGRPIHIDSLVAATDTVRSSRPRLTLGPLSQASGLPVVQPCSDRDPPCMLNWLKQRPAGQTTLIAWRHSKIMRLLAVLGVDGRSLLPGGRWPSDFFDWIVVIKYDRSGHIQPGGLVFIREPNSVNDAVWQAMDHPVIRPLGETK